MPLAPSTGWVKEENKTKTEVTSALYQHWDLPTQKHNHCFTVIMGGSVAEW